MTAGEKSSGWYKGLSAGGHAQYIVSREDAQDVELCE